MKNPIILSLLTGLTYAIVETMRRVGMKGFSPLGGAVLSNTVATIVLWAAFIIAGSNHKQVVAFNRPWFFVAVAGVLLAAMIYFLMAALKWGGVTVVTPVRNVTTLAIVAVLGFALLGEAMSVRKVLGILSCVAGIVLIS